VKKIIVSSKVERVKKEGREKREWRRLDKKGRESEED
jgi:hypothetical protein